MIAIGWDLKMNNDDDDYYVSYAHLCRAGDFLEDHIEVHGSDSDLSKWLHKLREIQHDMASRLDNGEEE